MIRTSEDLLIHELHAIEDAEMQATKALQQLDGSVQEGALRGMVQQRMQQGEQVLQDVRSCLDKLDGKSQGTQNAAARGLIQEAQKLMKEVQPPEMKQAVAIAGLQKLEHYCIAAWGTVKAMAQQSGQAELAQAMDRALKEGYAWDQRMTELAEGQVNPQAMEQGSPGGQARGGSGSRGGLQASGGDDLKSREYRGDDGKIHHHTRAYQARRED